MRNTFSELEFQFAVMMGYYSFSGALDKYGLYLPTASEEKKEFAADWFIESCGGMSLFLQFKVSELATRYKKEAHRNFRRMVGRGLFDRPYDIFQFKLRSNNNYLQHNMLYDKLGLNSAMSFYVAPVFTSKTSLQLNLKEWLNGNGIVEAYDYELLNNGFKYKVGERGTFSFFNQVIYIQPHAEIRDQDQHHYCFDRSRRVSFHSEAYSVKDGLGILGVIQKVDEFYQKRKLVGSTLWDSTNVIFDYVLSIFKSNSLAIFREYKLDQLGIQRNPLDDQNVLTQIERLRVEGKKGEFVHAVDVLLQEYFGISRIFIYPKPY